jgi:hypothetical protein
MCQAQFACFFDLKGNIIGEPPYQAGVLAEVNPPQACQYTNATSLDILPVGACALALPKGLNTSCSFKVPASQSCLIVCASGYVASVINTTNVSVSCGSGVLSPNLATLKLCKKAIMSGAVSASALSVAVFVFISLLL